jgi:hypothetical protein
MNANQIAKTIEIEQNSRNCLISGINNQIIIDENKRKICINGINNYLHVKRNLGIISVNGFKNRLIIDEDFTGSILKNGFNNSIQSKFFLFLFLCLNLFYFVVSKLSKVYQLNMRS